MRTPAGHPRIGAFSSSVGFIRLPAGRPDAVTPARPPHDCPLEISRDLVTSKAQAGGTTLALEAHYASAGLNWLRAPSRGGTWSLDGIPGPRGRGAVEGVAGVLLV